MTSVAERRPSPTSYPNDHHPPNAQKSPRNPRDRVVSIHARQHPCHSVGMDPGMNDDLPPPTLTNGTSAVQRDFALMILVAIVALALTKVAFLILGSASN